MYWKSKSIVVSMLLLIVGLNISPNISAAGQAAPYTEEAYNSIGKVLKEYPAPEQSSSVTVAPIDRHRASTEYKREVFKRAGYDWDATIRAVVHDLKNKTNKIPLVERNPDEETSSRSRENVASMVLVLMSYMKSHCEYDHVNCLDLFDSETAEAIKWLWGDTGFRP